MRMGFMIDKRPEWGIQIVGIWLLMTLSAFAGVAEPQDERKPARQIVLQGILGSKALLLVDGQRQMMSVKDAAKQGVRVLRIAEEQVDVEVDGKRRRLRLGGSRSVTGRYKVRQNAEVIISKNNHGMYSTVGSINGLPVSFLVDTGATSVAMSAQHAKRLAIDFRMTGEPTFVGTASGVSKAYRVTLDKVTVGGITQHNVKAVVIDGNYPMQVLLGMSFLGQLEIQRDGNLMRLKKKF
ncbi:MAG TPA: TIGR02281 family clan AA aspartic protease [Gammaproteobacteria bacterium]|nr:TIGR02281 family clan AA aspartic protease [Gammaproteobacteria bacterium]